VHARRRWRRFCDGGEAMSGLRARCLLPALAFLAVAPATAAAAPTLPLNHAGRWITDARGRVVVVHGINMVYKLPPYYPAATGFGDDDAAFLHRIGFNAVRVGVIWKALEPQPGVYDADYLNHIVATVRTLSRHGIVSLLDFHQDMYNELFQGEGAPDWAVQDDGLPPLPKMGFPTNYEVMPALQRVYDHFWDNSAGPGGVGLQDRYATAWRQVAQRFRSIPGVLGYELFNEPFPGTTYVTCALSSGCPALDAKLTAFNRRVDSAIRAADQRTLVWYEPYVLFNFGFVTNVGALGDPRAGFAWHDYCLTNEAQGCPSQPTTMAHAAQHVAQTHEATMMTEFGATNSVSDLEGMVAVSDQNMVPWLEWAYCGCNDPTGSIPTSTEAIVLDPAGPPAGSNLVTGTLGALVEPYPQAISGTPLSWGFDRASGTFTLRYSTVRASGHRRFERGAVSEIATPALVYGGRYAVTVKGGAILSRRGSGTLRIASCGRARTIAVTVRPHGRDHQSCRAPRRHSKR
jgi:endoglycosylceramidase